MQQTPKKRPQFVENVLNMISPGSKKKPTEQHEDFMLSPTKQKERREIKEEVENIAPKKEIFEEKFTTGWINPDLILQKNKRVLQTSALGHGNEHKDEDLKELSTHFEVPFNDKTFADVIFKVGKQSRVLYAHKVIVGNRSLYFRGVFSKSQTNIIELSYPEFSPMIFEEVIKYMYTGTIILKLDTVLDVLHLSEKFNVRSLSVLCCDFIQSNLDYNNVCIVLQTISKLNCPRLYTNCLQFIDKSVLNVLKSNSFMDLAEDLVILIISRDELELSPKEEIQVFNSIYSWAKHNTQSEDVKTLSKYADRVLKHIRFPLMPKNDLTDIIEPSGFVPQDLLMEAYKNHLVPQQSNHERFSPRLINSREKKLKN